MPEHEVKFEEVTDKTLAYIDGVPYVKQEFVAKLQYIEENHRMDTERRYSLLRYYLRTLPWPHEVEENIDTYVKWWTDTHNAVWGDIPGMVYDRPEKKGE